MRLRLLCSLCLFLIAEGVGAQLALPAAYPAYGVQVTTGIVYGHGQVSAPTPGSKALLLDLYEPVGVDPGAQRPALVIVHGGGFVFGTRLQPELVMIAEGMAARGHVVVSIDYRLVPDAPVPSARMAPILAAAIGDLTGAAADNARAGVAAIDDAWTAVDWLRAQADALSVDPETIGMLGGSAGAITAVHAGYVLDNYGIAGPPLSYVVDFWGGSRIPPDDAAAAAAHLDTGEPPLFVAHGTEDDVVPFEWSQRLVDRALDQDVDVVFHPLPGAGHGVDIFSVEIEAGVTLFDDMLRWTRATLLALTFEDGFESGDTLGWGETSGLQ
ncbi:MAG: alpha/beta hydrolase [Acidobacteriota bacterium]